ncbi:MAG: NAD-dependent epimerase/dehydratase family protein [Planctomycetota bacterium]|nr:NAD-dependent epimerase/dehydratase family protein [Planctomycetota bacterium]
MRVLVTGGAGFIGGHLIRHLLDAGHEVLALDDLSTGHREAVPSGALLVEGDVRDRARVAHLVGEVEVVFHLAAAVGPALVARDPAGTWSRNVRGTAAVLDACLERGARVLVLSSSEVYGDERRRAVPAGQPMREDELVAIDPGARRDVYALSKLAAESYALALYRSALLPVTVVRPFNVIGPGQSARYGMVVARFAEAAVAGRPLPVYGDGSQERCFLHVDDAVTALLALAASPAAEGRIVNVGGSESIAIRDLAARMLALAGSRAGIEHVPFERVYGEGFADHRSRTPDTSLLRELTSWTPKRTLDDALYDALVVARHA